MRWNSEERAFAVEAYFSSGCSVIATQRAFRNRFNLAPLAPVPDRKSIVTWVTTFRQTASATKRRTGVPRPVRSPENIEAVRASMLRSPRRSARKHASALRLSDRSVRRILRDDLHFHPYKMAIVQELSERDIKLRLWMLFSFGSNSENQLDCIICSIVARGHEKTSKIRFLLDSERDNCVGRFVKRKSPCKTTPMKNKNEEQGPI
ncbi:hypothetical protein ILUMI_24054 [Ignelater luminosus]|uniref:DUF4817 domain-containing protein n=1 Tax=Ignelater luminosus TaxID=2038154 RepID=A0A8K0FZ45_IGNLU|nr:hypothetical protein ILUMI_24054 [Ignelater luminosus]